MAKHGAFVVLYTFSMFILSMSLLCRAIDQEERKTYIVYMGSLPKDELFSPMSHQIGLLESVVGSNSAANSLLRSYKRSFNGFAAKLTNSEIKRLANMKEVVSVFPSITYQLQTTRSWDFLGLNEQAKRNATTESDVIVGVIDSGITPDSKSFADEGFGPPPKKWKGECNGGANFSCNNKLIGARSYSDINAHDEIGHGTHTASTAAGNAVKDVSFYGLARGSASGGVPSARIAAYKVCSVSECPADALLAAFDDAIADGVDIITISIGGSAASPLEQDVIAIGAFHAMEKGILTAHSAGNSGPEEGSVTSVAPWLFSVAASSTDRRIIDKIVLGNGKTIVGSSVNSFNLNASFPLIDGKDASSKCSELFARYCSDGCLDSGLVKGKIVLCDQARGSTEAHRAGAIGSIVNSSKSDVAFVVPFPTSALGSKAYELVKSYLQSSDNARAKIQRSEVIEDDAAPTVASFSSRGPNLIIPEIIKPDISAPGVDILAAYSPLAPITDSTKDERRVKYSILSGTSMSCPHVAGAAAYVKTIHPDWSPSAIKSSLMTTALPINDTKNSPGEFAYGSGHISPLKAVSPGLVYETLKEDYVKLLCSILDEASVRVISGDNSTSCSAGTDKVSAKDLNYPSLSATVTPSTPFTIKFHRRVKNVGSPQSTYKAKIVSDSNVDIKVVPKVLSFKSFNEEKKFAVTVVGSGIADGSYVSAALIWSDGTHRVRSPILLRSVAA